MKHLTIRIEWGDPDPEPETRTGQATATRVRRSDRRSGSGFGGL